MTLFAFLGLAGLAGMGARELKASLTPKKKKGAAKPVSDFKRRKAAQKGRGRRLCRA